MSLVLIEVLKHLTADIIVLEILVIHLQELQNCFWGYTKLFIFKRKKFFKKCHDLDIFNQGPR